ncbi:hypothetical protein OW789_08975 [Klebsiella pneumoniae]
MTKSTITRERVIALITEHSYDSALVDALEHLLDTIDSEADCQERKLFCSTDTARMRKAISVSAGTKVAPIYHHAKPAPVVPEEWTIADAVKFCKETGRQDAGAAMDAWNACRAAILQAEPVTAANKLGKSPVIPDGLPDGVNIYHGPKEKTILVLKQDAAVNQDCWCRTCRPVTLNDMRFVVCPDCGNKRCPRANDHRNACTGSNEPGREGSAYPDTPREVK